MSLGSWTNNVPEPQPQMASRLRAFFAVAVQVLKFKYEDI